MLINEEIIKILEDDDLDLRVYLTLLFAVYQKLDAKFFVPYAEEVKTLLNLNIVEFDAVNEGFLKMKLPLWSPTINSIFSIMATKKENKLSKSNYEKSAKLDVISWIDEWLILFPKGLNKIIGYDVHGNKTECTNRMSKFRRDNFEKFNKDTIIKATKLYLKERERERWQFTKKNVKFIYDENGSMLDNYCERIIDGDYDEDDLDLNDSLSTGKVKHW
jgi:hypothetical protein